MADKITFNDKSHIQPYGTREIQVWDLDINEIKQVVNTNADETANNTANVKTNAIAKATLAEIQALTPNDETLYYVLDDPDPSNNGAWGWATPGWYKAADAVNAGTFDPNDNVTPATQKVIGDWVQSLVPVVNSGVFDPNDNVLAATQKSTNDALAPNGLVESGETLSVKGGDIYTNLQEREKTSINNQTEGITPFVSTYNGVDAQTTFDSTFSLTSDGDYVEFTVKLEDLSKSIGIIGEPVSNTSCIGFWTTGAMYIRNAAGTWITTNGILSPLTIDGNFVKIKLSYEGGIINVYVNDVSQNRSWSQSEIKINNIGNSYSWFQGEILSVTISHSGGTVESIPIPYAYEASTSENVGYKPGDNGYLTPQQVDELEIKSPCYYSFELSYPNTSKPRFNVFVQLEGRYYAGFYLDYIDSSAAYSLQWRISECELYKYENKVMNNQNKRLLVLGECECVYKSVGKSDFTGGIHGDEQLVSVRFFSNGVEVSDLSADINLTACDNFDYKQISTMHETDDPSHTTQATHHKLTRFENKGYNTFNRLIWQVVPDLELWYHGISTVSKNCGEVVNNSYLEQFTANGDDLFKLERVDAREYYASNQTEGLSAYVTSTLLKPDFDDVCEMKVWDRGASGDNKYYREYLPQVQPQINDIWESIMYVSFDKKEV